MVRGGTNLLLVIQDISNVQHTETTRVVVKAGSNALRGGSYGHYGLN